MNKLTITLLLMVASGAFAQTEKSFSDKLEKALIKKCKKDKKGRWRQPCWDKVTERILKEDKKEK